MPLLITKYGQMQLHPTDDSHIFVEGNLVVNRVRYNVSAHLYKHDDGIWRIGKDKKSKHQYLCMSRHNTMTDATHSARKNTEDAIQASVRAWVKENTEELLKAQIEELDRQKAKFAQELVDATDKIVEINHMLNEIEREKSGIYMKMGHTVICKLCKKTVPAATAHLHQGEYIGDECCWDERLRSTE